MATTTRIGSLRGMARIPVSPGETGRTTAPALEAALWLILITAVFNFTPALFTTKPLTDAPLWTKAIKDGPVLLLLAVAAIDIWRAGRQRLLLRIPVFVGVLAIFAVYVAVNAVGEGAFVSAVVSARYLVLYPLLAVVIGALDVPPAVLRRLLYGVVGFGVFVSAVGFLEFLGILGPTAYATGLEVGGRNYARVIGTLGNPNNLGLFLALALLAAGWGGVLSPRVRTIAIVVMLAGLFLTGSKGASLALGLTVVIAFRPWRGRSRVVGAAVALALCIAFAGVAVLTRAAGSDSRVVGDRTTSVPSAIHATTASPKSLFFGHGFGTQSTVVNGEVKSAVSDNMALALTYEGGLPALILFGALVAISVLVAYRAWRGAQPAGDGPLVPWALYVPLVLFYSPFAVTFRLYPGALLYWIGVGLMIAAAWSPAREREWNSL